MNSYIGLPIHDNYTFRLSIRCRGLVVVIAYSATMKWGYITCVLGTISLTPSTTQLHAFVSFTHLFVITNGPSFISFGRSFDYHRKKYYYIVLTSKIFIGIEEKNQPSYYSSTFCISCNNSFSGQ